MARYGLYPRPLILAPQIEVSQPRGDHAYGKVDDHQGAKLDWVQANFAWPKPYQQPLRITMAEILSITAPAEVT